MSLRKHIPTGEALRFLMAGGSNTLFGIVDLFFFTWMFVHLVPSHAALMTSAANVCATVVNVTVSFLTYKLFVFKTKGNYLREYSRSWLVYLPSLALGTLAVAPLAAVLAHWLPNPKFAPYAAQATIIAVAILPQFLGHKKITFRKNPSQEASAASTEQ